MTADPEAPAALIADWMVPKLPCPTTYWLDTSPGVGTPLEVGGTFCAMVSEAAKKITTERMVSVVLMAIASRTSWARIYFNG